MLFRSLMTGANLDCEYILSRAQRVRSHSTTAPMIVYRICRCNKYLGHCRDVSLGWHRSESDYSQIPDLKSSVNDVKVHYGVFFASATIFLAVKTTCHSDDMPTRLPDGPDYLHLLLLLYGSRRRDPVADDRYGEHQRRVEVEIRLKLPRMGMSPPEILQVGRIVCGQHYQSIKHTQKWHCEFCSTCPSPCSHFGRRVPPRFADKPARLSQTDTMSWTHLTPPRLHLYVSSRRSPSTLGS